MGRGKQLSSVVVGRLWRGGMGFTGVAYWRSISLGKSIYQTGQDGFSICPFDVLIKNL